MKLVGWNGDIIEAASAAVPVMDHGFLYGIGLFETFRTYEGRPFRLELHLKRLEEGCRLLGIPYKEDLERINSWIKKLMERNGLHEAYIRYTITAGESILGLPAENYSRPNELLLVKELPPMPQELYIKGKGLQLLRTKRNTPETPVRLKSLHYMNSILAKRELTAYPKAAELQAEGLMLTEQGFVAEGMVSNLFFARNQVIYTPSLDTGILPGITRRLVLELAEAEGFVVEQGLYTWNDLMEAEEIWLTSSVQELVPVTTMLDLDGNSYRISNGTAGPLMTKLLASYRQETRNV